MLTTRARPRGTGSSGRSRIALGHHRSSPRGLGMYQLSGMYHDRCAILCQDSDAARRPPGTPPAATPGTTAPRATGELHEAHRGGGEDHAGHARDGGARGGRRTRRPRRRPRRRQGRRRRPPSSTATAASAASSPRSASTRSPGTGTRHRRRSRASASSSSAAPRRWAARRRTSSPAARRSTPSSSRSSPTSSCEEAGVEPLLHCLVTEPIVEGGCVKGVVTESKSGRQAILAQRVVDATGDADIAFRAGAPCHTHPRGSVMGVTVMFSCSGVDKARFLDHVAESAPTYGDWGKCWSVKTTGKEDHLFSPYLQEPFDRARRDGLIPEDDPQHRRHLGPHHGRGRGDLAQPGRHGRLRLHRRARPDARRDRGTPPGAARHRGAAALHARLRAGAPAHLRRHAGHARLAQDRRPLRAHRRATCAARRGSTTRSASSPSSWTATASSCCPPPAGTSRCPTGSSCPRDVDDLLVAGRCVAGDKISHAATRNQMCCAVTGQAAGVAAAVSLRDGRTTGEVDVAHVQAELRRQGVRLD